MVEISTLIYFSAFLLGVLTNFIIFVIIGIFAMRKGKSIFNVVNDDSK